MNPYRAPTLTRHLPAALLVLLSACGGGGDGGGGAGGGGSSSNNPPTAANDSASIFQGQSIDIDVLANDADPERRPLSVSLVPSSYAQFLQVNSNGSIRFAADNSLLGTVRFSYQIADSGGLTATAEVAVNISMKHPVVYVADDDTNLVSEIFYSDGVTRRKLNDSLPPGDSLSEFKLARSAGVAAYVQRSTGLVVASLRPGVAPRVVSVPPAGEFIPRFAISDDGRYVAYVVSSAGLQTLYLADITANPVSTSTVPLGSAAQTSVQDMQFQGGQLSYLRSRMVSSGVFESTVFRVAPSNPAAPVAITRTLTTPQSINAFKLGTNGSQVVYHQTTGSTGELTLADTTIPGSDRRLTPAVAPGSQIYLLDFEINAGGTRVYYLLAAIGAYYRLYAVDLASPGVARLLDPDMFPTTSTQISQIESFRLSTSNDRVAVRANVAGSRGGMTIDGSTGQVRYGYLSSTPDMGYAISPDGTMSIFAGQAARAVPWADPAGEFDFGGVLNTGYYFNGAYAPDGSAVAFVRYQTNRELYAYNPRPNNGSARWQMVALSKVPSNTRGVSQYQFAAAQPY